MADLSAARRIPAQGFRVQGGLGSQALEDFPASLGHDGFQQQAHQAQGLGQIGQHAARRVAVRLDQFPGRAILHHLVAVAQKTEEVLQQPEKVQAFNVAAPAGEQVLRATAQLVRVALSRGQAAVEELGRQVADPGEHVAQVVGQVHVDPVDQGRG